MATRRDLPYLLDSKSECPPLFNGTTRLYYFPVSPYSQCVKIALNYKGLDEIECLPISLKDKPTWYVEKVYPVGKVSSLTRKLFITSKLAEKKNVRSTCKISTDNWADEDVKFMLFSTNLFMDLLCGDDKGRFQHWNIMAK
jgi:hypothetical protein